jgi:hypothetical protein
MINRKESLRLLSSTLRRVARHKQRIDQRNSEMKWTRSSISMSLLSEPDRGSEGGATEAVVTPMTSRSHGARSLNLCRERERGKERVKERTEAAGPESWRRAHCTPGGH